MNETMLSPTQVAEHLSVNVMTIYRWIKRGKLPAVKLGRKCYRIKASDLKLLEKGGLT